MWDNISIDSFLCSRRASRKKRYQLADPTIMSYSIRDELGTVASTLVYIDYDGAVETVDGLTGQWSHYGGLIDAVTGGVIIGGEVKIPQAPTGGWKTTPVAGSRSEQTVLINFHPTGSIKRQGIDIPALLNSLIVGGKILTASGAVHTLILDVLAGFTNGHYADNLGGVLGSFADAALTFRKHRKQLTKSTEVYTD
jgi:hypothetical protein